MNNKFSLLLTTLLLTACGGGGGGTGGGGTTASNIYSVGGTLKGLSSGNSVTVTNNGADNTSLTVNGAFSFPTKQANNSTYSFAISTQPINQTCSYTYGAGAISGVSVTNINLFCGLAPVGSFVATGSLNTARYDHSATLLQSGEVLVVGGLGTVSVTSFLTSAELYDPTTGLWTATGSLPSARQNPTATLLPNGKVLLVGGTDSVGSQLTSAELYDPNTGLWTATGSLATARQGHTATLLSNGKVLVVGGVNSASVGSQLTSAELYDPNTGLWTATGSLATARQGGHTATLLSNGKVLVAGGLSPTVTVASSELYDPNTGLWTATGSLATARQNHTATLLPTGKVLVTGGLSGPTIYASSELYDPNTGLWTTTGSLSANRYSHTSTLLPSGKVLAVGGFTSSPGTGTELYDPNTGLWSGTGATVSTIQYQTATLLSTGKLLVAGGWTQPTVRSSSELYW